VFHVKFYVTLNIQAPKRHLAMPYEGNCFMGAIKGAIYGSYNSMFLKG